MIIYSKECGRIGFMYEFMKLIWWYFWYIFNLIGEIRGIGGIFFDDLDKEL